MNLKQNSVFMLWLETQEHEKSNVIILIILIWLKISCLHKIFGIKWNDFITNKSDGDQISLQFPPICKMHLNWLGHVAHHPLPPVTSLALGWISLGRRIRGRPKVNWQQTIQRDLPNNYRSWNNIRKLTADRSSWRVMTASWCRTRELLSLSKKDWRVHLINYSLSYLLLWFLFFFQAKLNKKGN